MTAPRVLTCAECGSEVWDLPHGHHLAKCWNSEAHAGGGTLAFDTMTDEDEGPIGDRCYCPDDCGCHYPWRRNVCGCRHHEVPAPAPSAAAIRATVERGAHDAIGKVV